MFGAPAARELFTGRGSFETHAHGGYAAWLCAWTEYHAGGQAEFEAQRENQYERATDFMPQEAAGGVLQLAVNAPAARSVLKFDSADSLIAFMRAEGWKGWPMGKRVPYARA